MTPQFLYMLAVGLVQVSFFCALAWTTVRQNKKDTNGLGKKYGRLVGLLIRWADTAEKREQLAQSVEPPK